MVTALPSWRSLQHERAFWTEHDAVIATDMAGRRRTFEVWVGGTPVGRRPSLDEAKALAQDRLGALQWERLSMPRETAHHYWFGPTDEFTDPLTIYVATVVKEAAAPPLPTGGMFGRGAVTLNPRVFDVLSERVLPPVREAIIGALDAFWTPLYGDWRRWAKVYVAGSAASYWWSSDHDLDVLIGIDKVALETDRPRNRGVGEAETIALLNRGLHSGLTSQTKGLLGFDVTYYVNPRSYDIRNIRPYAAYDLTADAWVVHPPVLPDEWGARSFPESWWWQAEALAQRAWEILALSDPGRTQLGIALFDDLHEQRRNAYSPWGHGWLDWGNFIWQVLSQWGALAPLYRLKHPTG